MIPELRHHMYLKVVPFNLALLALGCIEDADAARLIGVNSKTIERARDGGAVSDILMACAMAAFRLNAERLTARGLEIKLDTFFEEGTREDREPATLAEAVTNA